MKGWHPASPRYAEYVGKIAHCGHWELTGKQTSDIVQIRRIGTSQTLAYGTHDGGNNWNGPRNFAAQAQRACGCRFVSPRNRKRSRKKVETSGFSVEAARREQSSWRRRFGADLDALIRRRYELIDQMRADAATGRRDRICGIAEKLREVRSIEDRIADDFHQPLERFDPAELAP